MKASEWQVLHSAYGYQLDSRRKIYWRVLLNGENFWTNVDDSIQRLGFYTTRIVQASGRDEAEESAAELIRADDEFPEPLNDEDDPPEICAEEIHEIDPEEYNGPTAGFTFYNDESLPYRLQYHPTSDAIDSLARRFGLPNERGKQDWEFEVADPNRVREFLAAFEAGDLTDDEKFVLMNTIIQSIEDGERPLDQNSDWLQAMKLMEEDIEIHISTVAYWSRLDCEDLSLTWDVAPFMRELYARHRTIWEIKPSRVGNHS